MPKYVGHLFGFGGRQTAQDFARSETDFNHFSAGFIFGVRPRCARAATTRRAVVSRWVADPDDVIYVHIPILPSENQLGAIWRLFALPLPAYGLVWIGYRQA